MDLGPREWVVIRLRSGALRLVEAVVLPYKGPGKVLVPVLDDAATAEVERVENASCWYGTKRPARFRSGLACIHCDGSRRPERLGVAVLRDAGRTFVGTIRPADGGSWEYRIAAAGETAPGADTGETGVTPSAQAAFDAILGLAQSRGWAVDARPSPILDTAA